MAPKKKPRKGFTRSKKDWEESVAGHIGRFVDKLTVNDVLNLTVFGAVGVSTYYGIGIVGEQQPHDWLHHLITFGPMAPFYKYFESLGIETAKNMTFEQKVLISILAGYGAVKLPSIIAQTAPAVAGLVK